jgi:hypothetical protein
LKQLVRDHIDPNRNLGHSDRGGKKKEPVDSTNVITAAPNPTTVAEKKEKNGESKKEGEEDNVKRNPDGTICEDCR